MTALVTISGILGDTFGVAFRAGVNTFSGGGPRDLH